MDEISVAIVGSSCTLPGAATTPLKTCDLLCNPENFPQQVPRDRLNANAFYDPNPEHQGTSNTRSAYFLKEDPSCFNARFFNINLREAAAIDPQ
jgi:hybrid polyketide synthase/nonribosomal peptide synthetase ACE1